MENKGIATTAVSFEMPFCLYVDDGLYELVYENQPVAIQFFRRPRYSKVENLPFNRGALIVNADPLNCEIRGDRFGLVSYSQVVICMPSGVSIDEADPILERAVKYVNRFIEVYRVTTNEFWIQPIAQADIIGAEFRHCDENGKDLPGLIYGGPMQLPGLSTGGPLQIIASGIQSIKRSPDVHTKIKHMLKNNVIVPTYTNLMLDAQSSIRFGRFPLAVIQAQTAFENFFYSFVRYMLTKNSMSASLFNQLDTTATLKSSFKGSGGKDKLSYFSKLVTTPTRTFENGVSEHDSWYRKVYTLRNDVIHKGKLDVTQKQAEDAFKAVEASFYFFNQDWRNIVFS